MPPYYQQGRHTLYHGDCLAVLRTLPTASVDALVTDPPFLYAAKPSTAERNRGCEALPSKTPASSGQANAGRNHHPCVKSLNLLDWLCRLVTPPGGVVLDCFGGSGGTLIAADRLGLGCVYIDKDAAYCAIARARLIGDAPLLARAWEEPA